MRTFLQKVPCLGLVGLVQARHGDGKCCGLHFPFFHVRGEHLRHLGVHLRPRNIAHTRAVICSGQQQLRQEQPGQRHGLCTLATRTATKRSSGLAAQQALAGACAGAHACTACAPKYRVPYSKPAHCCHSHTHLLRAASQRTAIPQPYPLPKHGAGKRSNCQLATTGSTQGHDRQHAGLRQTARSFKAP